MINVFLTPMELQVAEMVGRQRQRDSTDRGAYNNLAIKQDGGLEAHILGARGEMAAAKGLGIYWAAGVNTFHEADLGMDIQVRTNKIPGDDLWLREGDNPEHFYILVQADASPRFVVVGWLLGAEGMVSTYLGPSKDHQGHGKTWAVPQSDLLPLFPNSIRAARSYLLGLSKILGP